MESHIHPLFRDTPPPEARLWRYLSFARYASLLQRGCLPFTRCDRFDDHFEGAWPKSDLDFLRGLKGFDIPAFTEQMKQTSVSASCWVEAKYESAAMWRLYAPGKEGVAITTTFGKLDALLRGASESAEVGLAGAGRVRYLDHLNEGLIRQLGQKDPLPNTLIPFMLKNVSYEHEKEVRGILIARLGVTEIPKEGICLPVKLDDFVGEIVVSPFSEDWFLDAVKGLSNNYGLKGKVRQSSLSPHLFYMRTPPSKAGK